AVFTISLTNPSASDVTVNYATADGTALQPGDYTAASGTATIPAGNLTTTVSVPIVDDAVSEPTEEFYVNLSGATNATIGDSQGVGTILDDDGTPSIAIDDVTVTEGDSATFTLTLSNPSATPITVDYATSDGTAVAGADYTAGSGTVTFPAGSTSQTVTVDTIEDLIDEPNETFNVDLSNPSGATIADLQGVGTILDDDGAPQITIDDVTVTEGVDANAVFTISLTNPSASDVTVDYATADGTALQPGDYTAASGTATIPAGSLTTTVSVPIVDDAVSEPTEEFYVNLSGATNATIGDSQGVGTILDDEANNPPVAVDDNTVTDEDTPVTIPVLENDSDPDGDTITVTDTSIPTHGATVVNLDGTITYTPDPDYCGQDSFTYAISDGNGGSDRAAVTITVNCVNDPPVAQDDTATTSSDTAVTIAVLANDADPDGTLDPTTVSINTPPSDGSVIVNADGTITYHPDPGFSGVDTFTYTVDDNEGLTSNIATVSVTVVSAGADIAVVKTAYNPAPNEGDTVNFTITVTNNGPDDASGVTVTDLLPVGLTYFSDTGAGAYDPATGIWTVGALAAGANATLTITATVNAGTGGSTITNTASATGDQPDPDTTNNASSVDVTVAEVAGGGGGATQECEGKVIINEVAWAGTAASPEDEWIELRNLGTVPVDLTGWTLRWRKKNPVTPEDYQWKTLELSGIIPP
ncbi:hypothetical protein DRJ23_06755, partial [Candidatus Acetothermia bacterium]